MKFNDKVTLFVLFSIVSFAFATPTYRLVSGDRGVILSIDNVQKEPAVQVELIDGNLSVTIPGSGITGTKKSSFKLGKEYWADSVSCSSSNGVAHIVFYKFRLSIEDMQKKFNKTRFLLLISPTKSASLDKRLFDATGKEESSVANTGTKKVSGEQSATTISDISIINRDGLEFVTITGGSLSNAKVIGNEKGVALTFGNALKSGAAKFKFPKAYLLDSTKVGKEGSLQLYFLKKDGVFSFAKNADNSLVLTFMDNREKDVPVVMGYSPQKKFTYSVKTTPKKSDVSGQGKDSQVQPKSVTIFLVKDNVNIRRSPVSTSANNIIGKFAFGTRFVAESKEGAWYKIKLESGETGWLSVTMAEDSANITASQWDAIHNVANASKSKPVVDEFNSPGKDPLLNEKQTGAFKLDSASTKSSGKSNLKPPVLDSTKKVAQIQAYRKLGRDPFLPLSTTNFVKPKLPKVDKLTLVGVIYDPKDGIALFDELVNGKTVSFSMRVGEQVENGKLLKIYERKVVFLMQEADFTYTIEKELLVKKE